MRITITPKDLEVIKLSNSDSGMVIDELAFSSGNWTSNDLWLENIEYEPNEPYSFNYEDDLFEATKTTQDLRKITKILLNQDIQTGVNTDLQAGAYIALNYPEKWTDLLDAYKDKLQEDRVDGISKEYNEQLQKEIDMYEKELRKEWLHGDYRGNCNGVIYDIAKYFINDTDGGSYDEKSDEFTFTTDYEYLHSQYCGCDTGCNDMDYKAELLSSIKYRSDNRVKELQKKNEERKAEREKTASYKKMRADEAIAERKAKLLSMKLK